MVWPILLGLLANAGVLLAATMGRLKVDSATSARLLASSFVLALSFAAAATASYLQTPAPPALFQQGAFAQPDDFHGGQALGILSGLGGGVGLFLLVFGCVRLSQAQARPPLEAIDDGDGADSYEDRDIAEDRSES